MTAPRNRLATRSGVAVLAACMLLFAITGCHSAFVNATVVNRSGAPIRLIEVDYPSASFGTEQLADGATFKSRFKIQGSGQAKVSWTSSGNGPPRDHSSTGPELREGQEGSLAVTIGPEDASWSTGLHP